MDGKHFFTGVVILFLTFNGASATGPFPDDDPLSLPAVGSCRLIIVAPALLELSLVTTKQPDPARLERWDFIDPSGQCRLPAPQEFTVSAGDRAIPVKGVGFRRRVLYAAFKERDLRIGNSLYLQLAVPIGDGQTVEVKNPSKSLWPPALRFTAKADPFRLSPVVHVNQTGYLPAYPKKAMIGYYLGTLGELPPDQLLLATNAVPSPLVNRQSSIANSNAPLSAPYPELPFWVLDARSANPVFQGALAPRPDQGFPFSCYQQVFEADFSALKTPGEYRLFLPGLGTSYPFFIGDGVAAAFARTYALGLYHQRCGAANQLPFTRFTHGPCHTAPAEVPDMTMRFESANNSLQKESANYKDNPRHTAPQLKNVAASLYPFVNRGPVDVRGGHHDAGDYSKYTINSAGLIHHLVLAADLFPGVSDLDNLGLPESGDGKSDILQAAKWEADFLAKMQDADGGFYFLVYPRDREYEQDVLPDHGDPQIVFPKNTAVTAAAVAALAQCASSPTFKRQFPEAAALYLQRARKGWAFLDRAIARYGKDGAYQKITHYGDEFMHDDELAWAACELYLATGEQAYHQKLLDWLHPSDPATRRWGWQRLYDAYGCAIRSYAFAVKTGRAAPGPQNTGSLGSDPAVVPTSQSLPAPQLGDAAVSRLPLLDPLLREQCEEEIAAAGADQLRRAQQSAYGTSLPEETKRAESPGWYFSGDAAFDLAVACQLDYPPLNDPRPQMIEALISNLNYEQGCNPLNITYLTGLGWRRQRQIVDQYAQNARRILPPTGIPLGNVQTGFGWLDLYQRELGELSFPSDGAPDDPYPFYDRWGDSFNLSQEFVILNQGRALGYLAWLMAQTPLKTQPWRAAPGKITGLPAKISAGPKLTLGLSAPGLDLSAARVVWEAAGCQPAFGDAFTFAPGAGLAWVEAEAQLPDGRRVFAAKDFSAR